MQPWTFIHYNKTIKSAHSPSKGHSPRPGSERSLLGERSRFNRPQMMLCSFCLNNGPESGLALALASRSDAPRRSVHGPLFLHLKRLLSKHRLDFIGYGLFLSLCSLPDFCQVSSWSPRAPGASGLHWPEAWAQWRPS